jgi:CxxC motif-containing protein (DUF1111 family)
MVPPRRFTSFLPACWLMFVAASVAQNPVGTILQHANNVEINAYNTGKTQFVRPWGIQEGVGPVFTAARCTVCHAAPVAGGNSTRTNIFFGKLNSDNSFDLLTNLGGPLLQPNSIAPVGVCVLAGEKVPTEANVVEKRLTPPVYGLGLIDAIDDQTIINGTTIVYGDGVHGAVNWVMDFTTNTVRPGRFGSKAYHSSLVEFVADAFAHDFGVSNPMPGLAMDSVEDKPQGVDPPLPCIVDPAVPNNTNTTSAGKGMFNLSHFVRYTSPNPTPNLMNNPGFDLFNSTGCAECHIPTMPTQPAVFYLQDLSGTLFGPSPSLSNVTVGLFSDLLLHDMGATLSSGFPANLPITGIATNSQWRTTPLWGLSLRHQYLHDGRTTDLSTAIIDHSPDGTGEAGPAITNYRALSPGQQQMLLDFLNTL